MQLLDEQIIGLLISLIIGAVLGGSYLWVRIRIFVKNLGTLLYDLGTALEDNKLDETEIQKLIKDIGITISDILSIKKVLVLK